MNFPFLKFFLVKKTKTPSSRLANRSWKASAVTPSRFNWVKIAKILAIGSFVSILIGTFSLVALFAYYAKDLPQPDKVIRREGFATKIFDRNGELLYEVFTDQRRTLVKLADVSPDLAHATVAIEDKNFYNHDGFDPLAYLRIIYNVIFKQRVIGGSTLTQQIVKNLLLSSDRTLTRKIKELILSIQIENRYKKDDILQIYLNEVPYGGTAWGVSSAAQTYFGKAPKDLTLTESAVLAGMPQSPSYYSPYGAHPDAFKGRTIDVLRRMREDGYITTDQENQSLAELDTLKFQPSEGEIKAPHFVMYVKKQLEDRYGENLVAQGGLRVTTTLDYKFHKKVQDIVAEEIEKIAKPLNVGNGAAVVINPTTGEILSMVGSKDYFDENYDGKVNVATSLRQPGSSIKPITYVTALRKGFTPESMLMDVETEFPGVSADKPYVPKNYNGKYSGPVSLRVSLGNSLNIPAVKLLSLVGVENMMKVGYEMGLPTFKPNAETTNRLGLSVTLGGGEVALLDLVNAYSTFANGGFTVEPTSILEVTDKDNNVLEKNEPVKGNQVLSAEESFLISNMLSDNSARLLTFGANSLLNINWRSIAVKTGTTDDLRDNWAIGWDPQVIVGVWVGNNDNSKMKSIASGVSGATPIWRRSILAYLEDKPILEFKTPSGIESIRLDKVSGYPAHDDFDAHESLIVKGSQPTGKDPVHVKLKVCQGQEDRLAPEAKVARGEFVEKEFFVFKEEDPFTGKENRWQKGIDKWVAAQTDGKYKAPTQYCDGQDDVAVTIESPEKEKNIGNDIDFKAKVSTNGDVEKVEFFANDKKLDERKEKPYEIKTRLDDGTYELKVKVTRKDGKTGETSIRIGVNKAWDWKPEPTSTPVPAATATPKPTTIPTSTPVVVPTNTPIVTLVPTATP